MKYIDTSALLKWFPPERGSESFGAWIATQDTAPISVLTRVEMRSTIARKLRNGDVDADEAQQAAGAFLAALDDGLFVVHALHEAHWTEAEALLGSMPLVSLRTLDTLLLACARIEKARVFATADLKLAAAARLLGMTTPTFD